VLGVAIRDDVVERMTESSQSSPVAVVARWAPVSPRQNVGADDEVAPAERGLACDRDLRKVRRPSVAIVGFEAFVGLQDRDHNRAIGILIGDDVFELAAEAFESGDVAPCAVVPGAISTGSDIGADDQIAIAKCDKRGLGR